MHQLESKLGSWCQVVNLNHKPSGTFVNVILYTGQQYIHKQYVHNDCHGFPEEQQTLLVMYYGKSAAPVLILSQEDSK